MARGGTRKKASHTYSPDLSGSDPLEWMFASFLPDVHEDMHWGKDPGAQPDPAHRPDQQTGTSQGTLDWLRRLREEGTVKRLQQQWSPRPELGWCEWCLLPRHLERDCAHTGPDGCCCCVYPDEEDEVRGLHGALHGGFTGAGFPPAPPSVWSSAPKPGPGDGRAPLAPLPGPPSDSPPWAGLESWRGEYGSDGRGSGPEEQPEDGTAQRGGDDGGAPTGGEESRQDQQPQVLPSRPARRDSPEPAATVAGPDPAGDPAPASPGLIAAAPVATRKEGPVPIRAAAPLATTDSGQASSGGLSDSPGASTAAAPPSILECGPGADGTAAPPAAVESGPEFFAALTPAGRPGVLPDPSPIAFPRAVFKPPSSSSPPPNLTPPLAPRTDGPLMAASRGGKELNWRTGPFTRKAAERTGHSPPLSSLCLSSATPDPRNRLVFDPGGWKLGGGSVT